MIGGVEIVTTASTGGLLGGLKRSVLGGESFFINTFTASDRRARSSVAPTLPGDIIHLPAPRRQAMLVQSGSWIASEPSVEVDTKWGGAKTFFSGEGLFMLHCSGAGDMLVSSYGAIFERQLQPGEVLHGRHRPHRRVRRGRRLRGAQGRRTGSPRSSAARAS